MYPAQDKPRCYQALLLAALVSGPWAISLPAQERMPAAQQNALVQKYCAVCHTDAAKNGGLSLEDFHVEEAPPSLIAMLLSKLTGGVSLQTAQDASFQPAAAALVDRKMRSGAMGAAGISLPDKTTIDALIRAFAMESAGATSWTVAHSKGVLTASVLREMPSASNAGEAEFYRLAVSCNSSTREGFMQLAWSPVPRSGSLTASVDGRPGTQYRVAGSETMGNGSGVVLDSPAFVELARATAGSRTGLAFPTGLLVIADLFPTEKVTFSFSDLPKDAREEFSACFPGANPSGSLDQ